MPTPSSVDALTGRCGTENESLESLPSASMACDDSAVSTGRSRPPWSGRAPVMVPRLSAAAGHRRLKAEPMGQARDLDRPTDMEGVCERALKEVGDASSSAHFVADARERMSDIERSFVSAQETFEEHVRRSLMECSDHWLECKALLFQLAAQREEGSPAPGWGSQPRGGAPGDEEKWRNEAWDVGHSSSESCLQPASLAIPGATGQRRQSRSQPIAPLVENPGDMPLRFEDGPSTTPKTAAKSDEAWDVAVGDDEEDDAASSVASSEKQVFGIRQRCRAFGSRIIRDIFGDVDSASRAHRFAKSNLMSRLSTLMTVANCVIIAIDTDATTYEALRVAGGAAPSNSVSWASSHSLQLAFLFWMMFEVLVGFYGMRSAYILGPDRWWNLLDVCILLSSMLSTLTSGSAMSFTRILRVARVSRSLRAMRFIRFSEGLLKMASAFASVALSLVWIALFLFLVVYIVGIAMMEGVTSFLEDRGPGAELDQWRSSGTVAGLADQDGGDVLLALQNYYGGVGRTWTSLFRGITGADWGRFAAPMAAMHWLWGAVWMAYLYCTLFGFLNIVIGIVVDIVRRPSPLNNEVWIATQAAEQKAIEAIFVEQLTKLGKPEDTMMSAEAVARIVRQPAVAKRLANFGINPNHAGEIFEVYAHDRGTTPREVSRILISFRGEAKAEDLARLRSEVQKMSQDQALLTDTVQNMSEYVREAMLNQTSFSVR